MNQYNDEVVKATYELYGKYHFTTDEIANLFNGKNIYDVISTKIYYFIERVHEYKKNVYSKLEEKDLEKILKENNNIYEEITKYIQSGKTKIEKIDSTVKECFLDDIDKITNILENLNEIVKKYDGVKFEKKRKIN